MEATLTSFLTITSPILVSLAGGAVAIYVARMTSIGQTSRHLRELERQEESIRQSQLTEVVRKRVETFPQMWSCCYKHMITWPSDKKPHDKGWVCSFLTELHSCNETMGVFLTEPTYLKMVEIRGILMRLQRELGADENVNEADMQAIKNAYFGGKGIGQGFSAAMKEELGSYGKAAIRNNSLS